MAVHSPTSEAQPAAFAASPLLAALRAGTRQAHQRVEAEPKMACLLSPDLSAASYIAALRVMRSFHVSVRQDLAPFYESGRLPAPDPDVLAALITDLQWFGVAVRPPSRARAPIASLPRALGALYVLEGSALGGRVIGRAVAARLAVSPGRGGSFYCGVTADGARERWRTFCADLAREGAALDEAGFVLAVAGANAAFGTLERLLRGRRSGVAQRHRAARAVPAAMQDPAHAAARTTI